MSNNIKTNNRSNNVKSNNVKTNNRINSRTNNRPNTSGINMLQTRFNIMDKIKNQMGINNSPGSDGLMNKVMAGQNKTYIIIAVILLIIILVVAGIFIYRYMNSTKAITPTTKEFIPYIHDGFIEKKINAGSIPNSSEGNEYNINTWIYINDYKQMEKNDKCIIYKGYYASSALNEHKNANPSVWFLQGENKLRVNIGLDSAYNDDDDSKSTTQCTGYGVDSSECVIDYFPLQKWINLNISLRNNVVDIFLNGKLHKSCILAGAPKVNDGDLVICPENNTYGDGFNGYISKFNYSNKALSSEKIFNMYKNGPITKEKTFTNLFGLLG